MAEPIVNESPATTPSRNDLFNAAHLKLGTASAIIDAMAMLEVGGTTDTLSKHSLSTCLLHADELIGEADKMFENAQAQPAEARVTA
jgi:hypothetical protein